MNKRKEWTFNYHAKEVAAAAERKASLHQSRLAYWTDQADEARSKIRESVEIREYDAGYYHTSNKLSADNMQVVADPERQRRYSHCVRKMQEHLDSVRGFKGFHSALKDQDQEIPLTVDDIIYFGLAEGIDPADDEDEATS